MWRALHLYTIIKVEVFTMINKVKLICGAIGAAALFSSLGWAAVLICASISIALIIKIAKELKKK